MKKLIIFSVLIFEYLVCFSQTSSTIDSLRQKHDTLWFSNRKGSVVYFRTLNDTLYFGDATGEKRVSQIGTGTGGVNFSDTLTLIATAYDLTQIQSGSSDSTFGSITVGKGGDTTRIDENGMYIDNIYAKGSTINFLEATHFDNNVTVEADLIVEYNISTYSPLSVINTIKGDTIKIDTSASIIFPNKTYLDKGYAYTPPENSGIYGLIYDSNDSIDRFTYAKQGNSDTMDITYGSVKTDSLRTTGEVIYEDTFWEDLSVEEHAFSFQGVNDPDQIDYNVGGSGIIDKTYEFAKNDIAYFKVQVPHEYKLATNIYPHVHWTPGTRGDEETTNTVGWKVGYVCADIFEAFGATPITADLSDANVATDHYHNITTQVSTNPAMSGVSAYIIGYVTRTDTGADDTWSSSTSGQLPLFLGIDFHFEIDTPGSATSTSKF